METTVAEYRNALLVMLAKHYTEQTNKVFITNRIKARAVECKIAPRFLALGVRLDKSNVLNKAFKITDEIGHAVGLGDGSREPPIEAVLSRDLLVYRFVLPEFMTIKSHRVRIWSDIYVGNPNLKNGVGLALDEPVMFKFTEEAPHSLVCGVSGSGKTELMKTIVYQLLSAHTPNDLGLAIVDPNQDFEALENESHLLYQPAYEFGDIQLLIEYFHLEYLRRVKYNIRDGRRLVLLVDEADQENVLVEPLNNERVNDIALRGRKFKMNLIIGTHTPDVKSLGSVAQGLTYRWLGLTSNARQSGQVAGGLSLHKLGGKGDFYNVTAGANSIRFQAAITKKDIWETIPRAEIKKVNEANFDVKPEVVNVLPKEPHRPKVEPDPYSVGYYLWHNPNQVTINAATGIGLSRTGHYVNRDFANKILKTLNVLKDKNK